MRILFVRGGALAVAALIAGGCGGGSASTSTVGGQGTFSSDYSLMVHRLKETSRLIGLAIEHASSQTDAQLGATFTGLAAQWETDESPLSSLTPPDPVASDYRVLTMAATRAEADLNAIVAAAQTHSSSAAKLATTHLIHDILQAKTASQAINRKLGIS
jgi:hypothetical protein